MENKSIKIGLTIFLFIILVVGFAFGDSIMIFSGLGAYFTAMIATKMSELEY